MALIALHLGQACNLATPAAAMPAHLVDILQRSRIQRLDAVINASDEGLLG